MPSADYQDLLASACELAVRAGKIVMDRWGSAASRRKDDGSLVTEADEAAQECIVQAIQKRYPHHDILAEERMDGVGPLGGGEYCWAVDPIDGTRSYARGFPCFATSIGVLERGIPVAGVVLEHTTGQQYCATAGGGATVQGVPIHVAERPLTLDFMVGVPSTKVGERPTAIQRLVERVNVRNSGSTAVHMALVATGALDAAFAGRCHCWDVAAGYLLVVEAGGVCTALDGGPLLPLPPAPDPRGRTPYLATGPHAHAAILDLAFPAEGA